ncbi:MAG TPA: NrtA/SsuA/CpmA family ABC transporter substrate-binding protein [Polyangiaceae bacterium]|nr:NrtA/SsuA/CpmA family ABC transporter substrate-binding protein [Polyangiaceae bacterium]
MTIPRRTLLAAGLLGAVPALTACRNTSPGLVAHRKVRLTYGTASVAKERGVLEKTLREQGIDVEWIGPFPNHAPTLQAVATGSADFSFGGSSTPAAQAILSGAKLTFVSWIVSTPRTTSIIVLPKSGITKVADLAGKTVAVNRAGVAEFLLVAALEKYAVPREKVNVVYMNPPDAAPAFAAGKVDAWAIWTGPLDMAEVQYGAQRIFEEGKELDRAVDFGTYLVREEYARQEPDTIRAVIAAQQAEVEWANQHRAEAQAIGYRVSKYPPAVIEKLNQLPLTSKLSLMNAEGEASLQSGVDWLVERKVLSGKLNVAEHSVRL